MYLFTFDASKARNDAERIAVDLQEAGESLNIKIIRKSLKRQGLAPKAARLFKMTTDSNHQYPVLPNLLNRNFKANNPNEK